MSGRPVRRRVLTDVLRSGGWNAVLGRILPLIEPTRREVTLRKFANFDERRGRP